MRIVSQILPRQFRHKLRHSLDSLYSKTVPDKETIGALSQWTIVTRDLGADSIIYSGGVGEDITFEQELIRRYGVKIHIFDPSPVAARTILLANSEALLFQPLGLAASSAAKFSVGGGSDSSTWLKAGGSNTGGSDTLACTSLAEEMKKNGHDFIDLLKIDIEGFEYDVLESCFAENIRIRQLCVEFHDFFPEIPKARTNQMIRTLESRGFDLIHRHRHDHTFLHRDAA
jgi:FkbM family methyltransferase